jgi:hypothetical protein
MKRIVSILFIVLALFLLAGCKDSGLEATATLTNIDPSPTSIIFDIELTDPKAQIGNSITVKVFNPNGSTFSESVLQDLTNLKEITVNNLLNGTTYKIEIFVATERKLISIGSASVTTLTLATIEISTTEQFLNMSLNRSGNYVLLNDLDFSGIAFNSPFTSAFSGTFDGQGFTIRNVNFEKISTYTGIFGYISSGRVKNLTIENVTIGTEDAPLNMTTSSRVGIIAGYVSNASAVIENVTVKDSIIRFTNASTVQAYVGAGVGELRATLKDSTFENIDIHLTSTSFGRIRLGGAVGFLSEDGILRQVGTDVDLTFIMNGNNIKDRDIQINVGGVVGHNNATTNNRSVENIYALGNIHVDLNFGTAAGSTGKTYSVSIGGLAGISYINMTNAFYAGSITVNHAKNDHEANMTKTFNIGGLVGAYISNRPLQSVVKLGTGNTMNIDIDNFNQLRVSQTFGQLASTATHNHGIYGTTHLMVNSDDLTVQDLSPTLANLTSFFTSDWIQEAYDNLS